jgi:hypothetical protein
MLSNGEIYHMAFKLQEEFLRKGSRIGLVELRNYLKQLNKQDMSKPEMEEKAREWADEKKKK